jgi:hypothetical protein
MIEFDHIAIGTSNLNDGVKWAESKLHSKIPYGGKHDQMGTHNHVLSSGNKTYLEILSKDVSAPPNKRNTWFGMNDPKVELALYKSPKIIGWVCRTKNINRTLALLENLGIDTDFGKPIEMSRGKLKWKFSLRSDGLIPLWGSAPILIEWRGTKHVSFQMADTGLRFKRLLIATPHKNALESLLWTLDFNDNRVSVVKATDTCITATYQLQDGREVSIN